MATNTNQTNGAKKKELKDSPTRDPRIDGNSGKTQKDQTKRNDFATNVDERAANLKPSRPKQ